MWVIWDWLTKDDPPRDRDGLYLGSFLSWAIGGLIAFVTRRDRKG